MANFTATVWKAAQWKLSEMMQMPEYKRKPSSALMLFKQYTTFLLGNGIYDYVNEVKQSDQQVVEVNWINKEATTAATARAAAHTGSTGDSTATTLTFYTKAQKSLYSIKMADRQVFTLEEIIAKKMYSAAIDLHGAIETALIAILAAGKSQVSVTPSLGTWDGSNYKYVVDAADSNVYFQRIEGFMNENYYNGQQFDVLSNGSLHQLFNYLANQGGGNATNLGFQLGNLSHSLSVDITNAVGAYGTGYIIPRGTIGLVPWMPKLNRIGYGDPNKVGGFYGNIPDPLGSGLNFAVHMYAAAADNNSTYGETQDVNIQVELSLDYAPLIAPMSTSNASPVFKTELLA